jgi:hypothetical protein
VLHNRARLFRLLRQLIGPPPDGTAKEKLGDTFELYQSALVGRLAQVPFEQRRQLLVELRQLILCLHVENQKTPKLLPKRVDDYFLKLGHDIENARQCQPKTIFNEAVPPIPTPAAASEDVSGPTVVQTDREKASPDNPSPAHLSGSENSR